jgi:AAA+ superfamily predicted ATPase
MKNRITNYIKAGYPGLFIISHEEARVEAVMREVIEALNRNVSSDDDEFTLRAWSVTDGVMDVSRGGKNMGCQEPMEMLNQFMEAPDRTLYLLRDFHLFVEDKNPLIWRKMRDCLLHAKSKNKAIVILGCRLTLPPELEKEITVLDFALPGKDQLRSLLHGLLESNGQTKNIPDEDGILSGAAGLTTTEAENAYAISVVEKGSVTRDIVFREKCQAVRKNGLLEVVDPKVKITLDDIGGLDAMKNWLLERRNAFGDKAKAYKLPTPKGFLCVGQPGTGKSLTAKACRSVFDIPLLRLDAAKLFGSLVGQSEANWRTAHATALAMAPCVLWIDEADGAFSGSGSSGQTDGGTTARVIKSILQDMQENSEGIFYVLTANDVDNLPAPLLRRMDEIWNVELPNVTERLAIWNIQIKKASRDPANFDLKSLAEKTEGYSGAEVEKIVVQSLYAAFAKDREPVTKDVLGIIDQFVPLSRTMADDITKRRKRLEGVAKLASLAETGAAAPTGRKLATSKVTGFKG